MATNRMNHQKSAIGVLLIAAGLIAFWQVQNCEFVSYDDTTYVTENVAIRNGVTIGGICWAFTTFHGSNWHPLTWISHMADIQLFGLTPAGHHLVNLLFHLANTALLFHVFHRMTEEAWKSALMAALFAVHPLHVESVAWIAERKDVLCVFFGLLAVNAYVSYAARPCLKHYSAIVLFFTLGLLSKPMLVTLPFALLLIDFWPLKRLLPKIGETGVSIAHHWASLKPRIAEKAPLFILTFISSTITVFAQQAGGAIKSLQSFPLDVRLGNCLVAYVTYLKQMILPVNLAVLYPHPGALPIWLVLLSTLFIAAVSGWVLYQAGKHPFLVSGWFWYLLTLLPVIGIVQIGVQAHADRYTYMPSIGLFVMLAWGIPKLFQQYPFGKYCLSAASIAVISLLMALTWIQVGYWKDSLSLYDHTLSVTQANFVIQNNRGDILAKIGDDHGAVEDFNRTLEINPRYSDAYFNRGSVLARRGLHREALHDFSNAVEIQPGFAEAYYNRAIILGRLGEVAQALGDFTKAIEIDPEYAAAYYNRGTLYGAVGENLKALADFSRAVEINPRYAKAYHNRGVAYLKLGSENKAIEDLRRAAELGYEDAKSFLRTRGLDW